MGFRRGFLLSVIGLFGFVVAVVLGFYFMNPMNEWLAQNVDSVNLSFPIISFLIIFLISMALISLIGWILKKIVNMVLLGPVDAMAGAVLGVVKAAFFISLFIWLLDKYGVDLDYKLDGNSELLGYIKPLAPVVIDLLEPFFPIIQDTIKKLGEMAKEWKDAIVD